MKCNVRLYEAICNDQTHEDKEDDLKEGPNELNVVRPSPVHVLIDKSSDEWTKDWTKERAESVDCHRPVSAKMRAIHDELNAYTHVATLAFEKRSLTEPPATLRNADPTNPLRNLNTRKTAVGIFG